MRHYKGIYGIQKVKYQPYLYMTTTVHPPFSEGWLEACVNSHCMRMVIRWSNFYDSWIALGGKHTWK